MKVLAIGNSFSQDATRYLQQIAKADGQNWKVVNLYIGGCSLHTHYMHMLEGDRAYSLEFNGETTGFYVSIKDALLSDEWDVITLQQVSIQSFDYETYQPYLNELVAYVRKYAPRSKIYLHQTWAYEEGSDRLHRTGFDSMADMFKKIEVAYERAYQDIAADGMILSGRLMQELALKHKKKVHRDTLHVLRGFGRYALALLWYKMLAKKEVGAHCVCPFDVSVEQEEIEIAIEAVNNM